MRRYIVSPITGVTVAAVVAAASAVMGGRPGRYRIGVKNKATGEVSLIRDVRTQAVLVGLGLNLLPWLADRAASLPVIGGLAEGASRLPVISDERVQDYAGLTAAAALISLFSSEGMDMLETGQFFGLPVPEKLVEMFRGVGAGVTPAALPTSAPDALSTPEADVIPININA